MLAFSSGDDGIEAALEDDHASGMLAHMAGQAVNGMEQRGGGICQRGWLRGNAGHVHLLLEALMVWGKIAAGI